MVSRPRLGEAGAVGGANDHQQAGSGLDLLNDSGAGGRSRVK
ncbi:hypothetical protein [Pseudomonas phage Lodos]